MRLFTDWEAEAGLATVQDWFTSLDRTSIAAPDGSATTFAYLGNTLTVTDAQSKWKRHEQDAFGNLVTVTEPRPGGGSNYTTSYTYNRFNQLLTVTMPRDGTTQTRTFTYLANGKPWTRTEPETGTTTFAYNSWGLLASKTDQKGQNTVYTYDSTYRRLQKIEKYPGATWNPADACQQVDFYWDNSPWSNFSAAAYRRVAAV